MNILEEIKLRTSKEVKIEDKGKYLMIYKKPFYRLGESMENRKKKLESINWMIKVK